MQYIVVDHKDIESPVEEGLYELVNSVYVLSTDTGVYADKTYYMAIPDYEEEDYGYADADVEVGSDATGLYEYDDSDDVYFATTDTVVQPDKSYFIVVDQRPFDIPDTESSQYYTVEDEVENPSEEGLYEIIDGVYELTEDTSYIPEKEYYRKIAPQVVEEETEDDYDPLYSVEDVVPVGVKEETVAVDLPENFLFAWTETIENPQQEGLYEIVNGSYILTADTEVVEDKLYFEYYPYSDYYPADMTNVDNPSYSLVNYYEVLNGAYVLTEDTTVLSGKTYYRSHREDEYPFVPDPTIGQDSADYEDVPYEE